MKKILKGDRVVIIAGKDKGKQGQVLQLLDDKVIVEGVNIVRKHQKPNQLKQIEGGIVAKSLPISISNVAILNPNTQKADRVYIKTISDKGEVRRVRAFRSNDLEVGV